MPETSSVLVAPASSRRVGVPLATSSGPSLCPVPNPKECGKDRSVLRISWRIQTFVCGRGASAIVHIYPSVLQALAVRGRTGRLEGGLQGYRGGAMQDPGYELRRILIPRTSVNKGRKKRERVEAAARASTLSAVAATL